MATANAQSEQPEAVVSEPTLTINIWLGDFLLALSFQFGVADRLYMHPSWMNRDSYTDIILKILDTRPDRMQLVTLVLFTCQLGSKKCRKTEYIDSELNTASRAVNDGLTLLQVDGEVTIVQAQSARGHDQNRRGNVEERERKMVKLSASKMQSRLLKTRNDTTWKKYLQSLRVIMQSIDECAKKVKKIQTSTLLTIQTEHQRQLSEGMKEFREVVDAVICSSTREGRTATLRRRFESEPTVDVLDESEM
ncbi:hypothetical protein B0H13DRAFT_1921848 [Mycena leptocephala]|nr:hypothetical protein B0H13DRAFT_1921848 [Mycena leptocephala]